jgi:NhaP-type Na+/H+ or K+/H+ antiporter
MLFSSLISTTDPVTVLAQFKEAAIDETLYSLIFGESILNDGTGLILFESFTYIYFHTNSVDENYFSMMGPYFIYLFVGSSLLGLGIGLIASYVRNPLHQKTLNRPDH